jgi:hypothetical protein
MAILYIESINIIPKMLFSKHKTSIVIGEDKTCKTKVVEYVHCENHSAKTRNIKYKKSQREAVASLM